MPNSRWDGRFRNYSLEAFRNEPNLLYAGLAFAALPVTDMLAGRLSPRARAASSTVAALIGLVLIVRLFMTR